MTEALRNLFAPAPTGAPSPQRHQPPPPWSAASSGMPRPSTACAQQTKESDALDCLCLLARNGRMRVSHPQEPLRPETSEHESNDSYGKGRPFGQL